MDLDFQVHPWRVIVRNQFDSAFTNAHAAAVTAYLRFGTVLGPAGVTMNAKECATLALPPKSPSVPALESTEVQ